jgi:hypothetical protein
MKKYTSIFVSTFLASVVCAIFQEVVSFLFFMRNLGIEGGYPVQALLVSFVFSFVAIFIPLLGYNVYVKIRENKRPLSKH